MEFDAVEGDSGLAVEEVVEADAGDLDFGLGIVDDLELRGGRGGGEGGQEVGPGLLDGRALGGAADAVAGGVGDFDDHGFLGRGVAEDDVEVTIAFGAGLDFEADEGGFDLEGLAFRIVEALGGGGDFGRVVLDKIVNGGEGGRGENDVGGAGVAHGFDLPTFRATVEAAALGAEAFDGGGGVAVFGRGWAGGGEQGDG